MPGIHDPPTRHRLLRCLRSFLPAEYDRYTSLVTPCRLASGTLLAARETSLTLLVPGKKIGVWMG